MIEALSREVPEAPDRPELAGPDHPIRKITQAIAFEREGWTPERAAKVAELFDSMAEGWNARESITRSEPLLDGLARGAIASGLCVEIGSGTGIGPKHLATRFERVIAIDLSMQMLRFAPTDVGDRVHADAFRLPIASGAADAMVLVNAFLFPAEVDRVLAPDGTLLFVSSIGDRTPIYLAADEVERALPGAWQGVTADAGWGSWSAFRRVPSDSGGS